MVNDLKLKPKFQKRIAENFQELAIFGHSLKYFFDVSSYYSELILSLKNISNEDLDVMIAGYFEEVRLEFVSLVPFNDTLEYFADYLFHLCM